MTERTVLLPAAATDLLTLSALWNDAGVRELLFDGDTLGPTQARRLLDAGLAEDAAGLGWWLVCPWSNAPAVGCVGLLRSKVAAPACTPSVDVVETMIAFGPEAWVLGYAHEALKELVWHALHRLCLPRLSVLGGVQDPMFDQLLRALGFEARLEADAGRRRLRRYELQAAPVIAARAGAGESAAHHSDAEWHPMPKREHSRPRTVAWVPTLHHAQALNEWPA